MILLLSLKLHRAKSEVDIDSGVVTAVPQKIYTAPTGGSVIQNLQIANISNFDAVTTVRCFDGDDFEYRVIRLAMKPKQVFFILERYAVMGANDYMTVESDNDNVEFSLSIADNKTIEYGSLKVNIEDDIGRWSINNGVTWNLSGVVLNNLVVGNYVVVFEEVEGYETPKNEEVSVISGQEKVVNVAYQEDIEDEEIYAEAYLVEETTYDNGEINGVYEKTQQVHNDKPTYEKKIYFQGSYYSSYYLYYQKNTNNEYAWSIGTIIMDSIDPVFNCLYYSYDIFGEWQIQFASGTVPTVSVYEEPSTPPVGSLKVNVTGMRGDTLWSIDEGYNWYGEGETILDNLEVGEYFLMFEYIPDYEGPESRTIIIEENQTTVVNVEYVIIPGFIKVNISGTNDGRWSVDDGSTWYESGYSLSVIPHNIYNIIFKDVPGFETPQSIEEVFTGGESEEVINVTYIALETEGKITSYLVKGAGSSEVSGVYEITSNTSNDKPIYKLDGGNFYLYVQKYDDGDYNINYIWVIHEEVIEDVGHGEYYEGYYCSFLTDGNWSERFGMSPAPTVTVNEGVYNPTRYKVEGAGSTMYNGIYTELDLGITANNEPVYCMYRSNGISLLYKQRKSDGEEKWVLDIYLQESTGVPAFMAKYTNDTLVGQWTDDDGAPLISLYEDDSQGQIGYLVEGAGSPQVNDFYEQTEQENNGRPVFVFEGTDDIFYLLWDGQWILKGEVPVPFYINELGEWSSVYGNDPVPLFTKVGDAYTDDILN